MAWVIEPIEVGAERGAAVVGERGAQPARDAPRARPRSTSPLAAAPRRPASNPPPTTRVLRDLFGHALEDPRVDRRTFLGLARLRLLVDRGRPPVEHALVRGRAEQRRALPNRLEELRRGAVSLFEVERLGEADRQLDALGRVERRRVDHAQRLARGARVALVGRLAKTLELNPPKHDARGIGARRDRGGLARELLSRFVLSEVVEAPGFGQRVRRQRPAPAIVSSRTATTYGRMVGW